MLSRVVEGVGSICWFVLALAVSCHYRPAYGEVMGGKLNVYNLGELGVVVDKSPVHQVDGEMLQAQNAVFDPEGVEGGIRKRGGLAKLNAVALAGAVRGIVNVPYADPTASFSNIYVLANITGGAASGQLFLKSQDGSTWTVGVEHSFDDEIASGNTIANGQAFAPAAVVNGKMFTRHTALVTSDLGTIKRLVRFDGAKVATIAKVPLDPEAGVTNNSVTAVGGFYSYAGKVYFVAAGSNTTYNRAQIFELDPETEIIRQVGNAIGTTTGRITPATFPVVLCDYLGRLWFFPTPNGGLNRSYYYIRPGVDDAWTVDHDPGADTKPTAAIVYHSKLYVGVTESGGVAAYVLERDAAGTWSTSDTSGYSSNANHIAGMAVFDDKLFAVHWDETNSDAVINVFDGTSWTEDHDFATEFGVTAIEPKVIFVEGAYLYVVFEDRILRRDAAGTWSQAYGLSGSVSSLSNLAFALHP